MPPYEWNLQLLGISLAAFLAYFVALGALAAAKRRGWLTAIECRGPPKPHKVARRAWAEQWGGGGKAPPSARTAAGASARSGESGAATPSSAG